MKWLGLGGFYGLLWLVWVMSRKRRKKCRDPREEAHAEAERAFRRVRGFSEEYRLKVACNVLALEFGVATCVWKEMFITVRGEGGRELADMCIRLTPDGEVLEVLELEEMFSKE